MATALRPGLILLLFASAALAQQVVGARAGTVHFTMGSVSVDGLPVQATEVRFPLLRDGQVVQTGRGRLELLLAPEVFLRLSQQGTLRLTDTHLDNTQVELISGTALVEVVAMAKNERIQIRYGVTRTEFKGAGLYRFDAGTGELRVFGGDAEVMAGDQKLTVGRGRLVYLGAGLLTAKFDVKKVDSLHKWSAERSFYLYASSAEARLRRTDWEFTFTGWSWNKNFDMRFYSPIAAAEYRRRLDLEERMKAAF